MKIYCVYTLDPECSEARVYCLKRDDAEKVARLMSDTAIVDINVWEETPPLTMVFEGWAALHRDGDKLHWVIKHILPTSPAYVWRHREDTNKDLGHTIYAEASNAAEAEQKMIEALTRQSESSAVTE